MNEAIKSYYRIAEEQAGMEFGYKNMKPFWDYLKLAPDEYVLQLRKMRSSAIELLQKNIFVHEGKIHEPKDIQELLNYWDGKLNKTFEKFEEEFKKSRQFELILINQGHDSANSFLQSHWQSFYNQVPPAYRENQGKFIIEQLTDAIRQRKIIDFCNSQLIKNTKKKKIEPPLQLESLFRNESDLIRLIEVLKEKGFVIAVNDSLKWTGIEHMQARGRGLQLVALAEVCRSLYIRPDFNAKELNEAWTRKFNYKMSPVKWQSGERPTEDSIYQKLFNNLLKSISK